jgi:hypothetical protein
MPEPSVALAMLGIDTAAAEAPSKRASVLRENDTLKTSPWHQDYRLSKTTD